MLLSWIVAVAVIAVIYITADKRRSNGSVAQLVGQRSPKPPDVTSIPGSNPGTPAKLHTCALCERTKRALNIRDKGTPEDMQQLITELYSDLCSAEEDNNRYTAILDGTWPSSQRILQHSLERATA